MSALQSTDLPHSPLQQAEVEVAGVVEPVFDAGSAKADARVKVATVIPRIRFFIARSVTMWFMESLN